MRPYLILTLLSLGASSLRAQTPEIVKEIDDKLNVVRAGQRNEDIEILRLLMNRAFGFTPKTELKFEPIPWGSSTVPYGGSMAPDADTAFDGIYKPITKSLKVLTRKPNQEVGPFDGLYLSGAGVVYTLRIPAGAEVSYDPFAQSVGLTSSCSKCHAGVAPNSPDHKVAANASACTSCHTAGSLSGIVPADKPLTDWERAKLELRGEKPSISPVPVKPVTERAVVCQPGSLSEQLQRLLFAYGKNVGHLAATEKITVAITFDETPGAKPEPAAPTSRMGFTPEELQKLTLGDLHAKQQKHKEALAAYREGLTRFQALDYYLQLPVGVKGADAMKAVEELQARVRQLYQAIAMAQLATQDLDGAKTSLELAQNFKIAIVNQPMTSKPRLPAKLIVSVAAGDLAKAADYAAFQKLAKVELQNFPAPKAKPVK